MDFAIFENPEEWKKYRRSISDWEKHGVRFVDSASNTYIDKRAAIQPGVVIWPGVTIFGCVFVRSETKILPGAVIVGDSAIGEGSVVLPNAILSNVQTGKLCVLGGHLTNVRMGDRCRTGPLSEMTRCELGNEVTCIHHSFLGDTQVWDGVNIGAGVITSNFDGEKKKKTVIGSGSFIGVNVNLVAKEPALVIGCDVFIAAGVTIRQDIPDGTFVKPKNTNGEELEFRTNLKKRQENNRWRHSPATNEA